jgi:hypothetical protein
MKGAGNLWHVMDGTIIVTAWIVATYDKMPLVWVVPSAIIFWLIFYRPFNLLYHYVFTRKKHRDWRF